MDPTQDGRNIGKGEDEQDEGYNKKIRQKIRRRHLQSQWHQFDQGRDIKFR